MKIIFMGTPDFATPALKKLLLSNHEVVSVFTAAPKKQGRGMILTKSPVHQLAESNNINVYTPKTLRSDDVLDIINKIEADIIVVIAYGFIIPASILNAKRYGCLNIHPSKLPRFRGAAPLQRTIISGDRKTSVCIMQMDEGLDTGDILLQDDFDIDSDITLQFLHDICANKGAELLIKTLDNIDNIVPLKQSDEGLVYAYKLTKEEGRINWNESSIEIDCKIRGMNPWPGTYCNVDDSIIKILKAKPCDIKHNLEVGVIENNMVACGSGMLEILSIQKTGKQAMSFAEFLRGMPKLRKMD